MVPIHTELSKKVSTVIVGDGNNDFIDPDEETYEYLQKLTDQSIFWVHAVELEVTLLLEDHHVWRRLVVPLNRNFRQLHDILQVAFNWKNYHLHEFYLYETTETGSNLDGLDFRYVESGYEPIVCLVDNEESFAYPNDVEMKMGADVKLSDYIPNVQVLLYNYDFGDNWQHQIEVVRVFETSEFNHPVCLDGIGNAPPEDVGGEGGYEEFLRIMADPKAPEHEHMKQWLSGQGYETFNIDWINRRLKDK